MGAEVGPRSTSKPPDCRPWRYWPPYDINKPLAQPSAAVAKSADFLSVDTLLMMLRHEQRTQCPRPGGQHESIWGITGHAPGPQSLPPRNGQREESSTPSPFTGGPVIRGDRTTPSGLGGANTTGAAQIRLRHPDPRQSDLSAPWSAHPGPKRSHPGSSMVKVLVSRPPAVASSQVLSSPARRSPRQWRRTR